MPLKQPQNPKPQLCPSSQCCPNPAGSCVFPCWMGRGREKRLALGQQNFPNFSTINQLLFSSSSIFFFYETGFSLSGRMLSCRRLASWWLLSWAWYQQEVGDVVEMGPGGGQSLRSAHKAPGAVQPSTEETSLSVDWSGLYRQTPGG